MFNVVRTKVDDNNKSFVLKPADFLRVVQIRINNNDILVQDGRRFSNLFYNWRKYSIGKQKYITTGQPATDFKHMEEGEAANHRSVLAQRLDYS